MDVEENEDYIPRIVHSDRGIDPKRLYFVDNETEDNDFSDETDNDDTTTAVDDWQDDFIGDNSEHPMQKAKHYVDRLTPEFKSLMGEANLRLAKGDRATAKNICLEIIRNIPESPAPYETLSVIFEEENNLYESVQYGLVSAHLWPGDPMKWYSLAMKCIELKDDENSKICMTKALRYSHLTGDRAFIEEILDYYTTSEEIDEATVQKFAIGYRKLIKISDGSDRKELIALVDNYEKSCDKINKPECWIKVVIPFYKSFPEQQSEDKISKICDVYLRLQWYSKVADVLKLFGFLTEKLKPEITAESELEAAIADTVALIEQDPKEGVTPFSTLSLSKSTPHILRSALVTALVYLEFDHFTLEELATPLFTKCDPNSEGHLLLQIADAYFHVRNFSAAFPVYEQLANSSHSEHVHTWLRCGECRNELGQWQDAVKMFEFVLSLDKNNAAAKLKLFALQQEHMLENQDRFSVNIHEDPENVKDLSTRPDIVKLSYHRTCQLLKEKKYDEVYDESYNVLRSIFLDTISVLKQHDAAPTLRGAHRSVFAMNYLQSLLKIEITDAKDRIDKYKAMLSREVWYEWYISVLNCTMPHNQYKAFILTLGSLSTSLLDFQPYRKNAQVHSIVLADMLNHPIYISEAIGLLLYTNPANTGVWNLFFEVKNRLPHARCQRIGVRWLHRNQNSFHGLFLNAQNTYQSRQYRACIGFFRQLLSQQPNNAKLFFYLALAHLHFASNKSVEFTQKRHVIVVQALACFFVYQSLRGTCQETYYNIGRCYHQLGLFTKAIQYYKKVLVTDPGSPGQVLVTDPGLSDQDAPSLELNQNLRLESVHNMCQIYANSGSEHLARNLLYKHLVIT